MISIRLLSIFVFAFLTLHIIEYPYYHANAATFIVSEGNIPSVQRPVTFTTYAPLASFGGTPSTNGNVTLEVMQPSAASGCEPFSKWSTNMGQVVLQLTDSINCAEIIVKTVLNLGESQSSIERCILRVLKRFRM